MYRKNKHSVQYPPVTQRSECTPYKSEIVVRVHAGGPHYWGVDKR